MSVSNIDAMPAPAAATAAPAATAAKPERVRKSAEQKRADAKRIAEIAHAAAEEYIAKPHRYGSLGFHAEIAASLPAGSCFYPTYTAYEPQRAVIDCDGATAVELRDLVAAFENAILEAAGFPNGVGDDECEFALGATVFLNGQKENGLISAHLLSDGVYENMSEAVAIVEWTARILLAAGYSEETVSKLIDGNHRRVQNTRELRGVFTVKNGRMKVPLLGEFNDDAPASPVGCENLRAIIRSEEVRAIATKLWAEFETRQEPSTEDNFVVGAEVKAAIAEFARKNGLQISKKRRRSPFGFFLDRVTPGACPICKRVHDSDGGFVILGKNSAKFGCFRERAANKPSGKPAILVEIWSRPDTDWMAELDAAVAEFSRPSSLTFYDVMMEGKFRAVTDDERTKTLRRLRKVALFAHDESVWVVRMPAERNFYSIRPLSQMLADSCPIVVPKPGGGERTITVTEWMIKNNIMFMAEGIISKPYAPREILPPSRKINICAPFPPIDDTPNMELANIALDAIRLHWANGVRERFDYIIRWLAEIVQHPRGARSTVLVIRGKQGTGKSLLASFVGQCFGSLSLQVNPRCICDKFNATIEGKLLLCVEGICDSGVHSLDGLKERVRMLSTEDTMVFREKRVSAYTAPNHVRLLMLTDKLAPGSVDRDEGFAVFTTSAERVSDRAYWIALAGRLRDKAVQRAFLTYLATMDLSGFDIVNFPRTEARVDTLASNYNSVDNFMIGIARGEHDIIAGDGANSSALATAAEFVVPVTDLYRQYSRWCADNGHRNPLNNNAFAAQLKPRFGDGSAKWVCGKSVRARVFSRAAIAAAYSLPAAAAELTADK